MKRKLLTIFLATALICAFTVNVFAATTVTVGTASTWNSTPPQYYEWRPNSGSITPTFYKVDAGGQNYAKTYLDFTLTTSNVTAITAFNNGTNSNWQGKPAAYFGMDTKNVPSSTFGNDMMDAYSIATSLPNPKTDLENNDIFGTRNDEAEVVALGTVSATTYYMSVMWYDYRTGSSSDNGQWNVNCEISSKGVSDYNVIQPSGWNGWAGCTNKTYSKNAGGV